MYVSIFSLGKRALYIQALPGKMILGNRNIKLTSVNSNIMQKEE